MSEAYRRAGVDVEAGYEAVKRIRKHVESTRIPGVLGDLGGFGGQFEPDLTGVKRPVLVSGTDGVGTKLKLAFLLDKHDTIGIDCVAMCANDVACAGAKPLFFLDYIACGRNKPERIESIVKGLAEGCSQAGCAIVGGETAEMPGFYPEDEYDLAGFCVGLVDHDKRIDGQACAPGDVLLGLPSSGAHSNGFSLIRRIVSQEGMTSHFDDLGSTLGEALLTPTRIYVSQILKLADAGLLHGVAHITGGGFYENIPRMFPKGLTAVVDRQALKPPTLFELLQRAGHLSFEDMYGTFNMGVGLVLCVDKTRTQEALTLLEGLGENVVTLGELRRGDEGISFE